MMNQNDNLDELNQLRQEMADLKHLLSQQKIISDTMLRRALRSDYSKERGTQWRVIAMVLVAFPIYLFVFPQWGFPMWFIVVTLLFLGVCVGASIYSVRRYVSDDLGTCALTEVAENLIAYKRFSNNWLKFSIPILMAWLVAFFWVVSQLVDADVYKGMFIGGVIGGIIGCICGVAYYVQSQRRLDKMISQIRELKQP